MRDYAKEKDDAKKDCRRRFKKLLKEKGWNKLTKDEKIMGLCTIE